MVIRLFLISITLAGCVYGPKAERKSPLNYLSGDHYESSAAGSEPNAILSVPILKRRDKPTRISGRAIVRSDIAEVGVLGAQVTLLPLRVSDSSESKVAPKAVRATTSANGEFTLTGTIPNGVYRLTAASRLGDGQIEMSVDEYEMSGVVIELKKRQ